jgi:hypothetical protein
VARAEALARAAATELGRQGAVAGQATALATAALAAAAQGNGSRADETAGRALSLAAGNQDLRSRLIVELRSAQLRRAANSREAAEAVLAEATRAGLRDLQLEAALALSRIEIARGQTAAGEARRASVQREATRLGYAGIARKAAPGTGTR